MQNNNHFRTYLLVTKNNSSDVMDITDESRILIDVNEVTEFGIKRKHIDQYLFRHKDIKAFKKGQKKLVQASFLLNFILNDIKRLKRKENKNI